MAIVIGRVERGTTITTPGKIWFPQVKDKVFSKVEIVGSDDSTTDISEDVLSINFTWPTIRKGGTGTFNIEVGNPDRKYIDVFAEGDLVKISADFTDGTTQIFEGKTEEPMFGFNDNMMKMILTGMKDPEIAGKKISVNTTNSPANALIESLFTEHFGNQFTFNNIDSAMTAVVTLQDSGKTFLNIIRTILSKVKFDGYIDIDNDIHTFPDTGVVNSNEAFAQGINILNITPSGRDTMATRNSVTVYGAKLEGIIIIKRKKTVAISWDRDEIKREGGIKELIDAQERADGLQADLLNRDKEGSVTTEGIVTIRPGNQINIRVPDANLEGDFFIANYTHNISVIAGWTTSSTISEIIPNFDILFFNSNQLATTQRELDNANDMIETVILDTFDNLTKGSFSDCKVDGGKLILESGKSQGTYTSNTEDAQENFTNVEVRGIANTDFTLAGGVIEASNNGGRDYKIINNFNELTALNSASNNQGRIKITIKSTGSNPNPSVDSIGLLVK